MLKTRNNFWQNRFPSTRCSCMPAAVLSQCIVYIVPASYASSSCHVRPHSMHNTRLMSRFVMPQLLQVLQDPGCDSCAVHTHVCAFTKSTCA